MAATPTTFGERLRSARKAGGLTGAELGARVGLHWSAVGHHETGRNSASLGLTERYARALNVNPGWLAFGEVSDRVPEVPPSPAVYDCMSFTNPPAGFHVRSAREAG